jgi:hypothetical protein
MAIVDWLKTNTWIAEWLGTMIAMFALILPAAAKFFGVHKGAIETLKQDSYLLWLLAKGATSRIGLVLACVIEALAIVIGLLVKASVNCLGLYLSALFVLLLMVAASLREEQSERAKIVG